MHNRLLDHIRSSPYPISIIVDGSTDISNNHLLAILIQTLEDEMPMNYYYALVKLQTDESAESQTQALIDKLTTDNIYEAVQSKIVSFVSDGASVMTGKKQGMATRLKKAFPKLISVHCSAHRIELVFGNSMEEYDSFQKIEAEANILYSFFSRSHKRFGDFQNYLSEHELNEFNLHYIKKTRWVASHRRAMEKIFENLPEIIGYLEEVVQRRVTSESDKQSKKKAEKVLNFVSDKNAVLLIAFNLDAQNVFVEQSLAFQSDDDSIISLSHSKQNMIAGIDSLRYMHDDSVTKKFLSSTVCDDGQACETIQGYEQSRTVSWHKSNGQTARFDRKNVKMFDKLSEVKEGYLNKIMELLHQYLPEIEIMDFDLLDQRMWQDQLTEKQVQDKLVSISKELKLPTPTRMGNVVGTELYKLISEVKASPQWCRIQDSKPNWFWSDVLKNDNYIISEDLKNVIRSAMVIPLGSSSAERVFGILKYAKNAYRSRLSVENTDHTCRIRDNGPNVKQIGMRAYCLIYLQDNARCDPLFPQPKRSRPSDDDLDMDEKRSHSNIFI